MRVFGNITNRIMEMNATSEITVGMGATITMFSDRHACTVIAFTHNTVNVQMDHATRIDKNGISDCQKYEYSANSNGVVATFKKSKKGVYKSIGYSGLVLGTRQHYHDFGF